VVTLISKKGVASQTEGYFHLLLFNFFCLFLFLSFFFFPFPSVGHSGGHQTQAMTGVGKREEKKEKNLILKIVTIF